MNRRLCATVVLLSCWLQARVFAANVTVLDTDSSIVYSPAGSWFPSSNICSTCLNPGPMSYHEALGLNLTVVNSSSTSIPTAPPLPPPTSSPTVSSGESATLSSSSLSSPPTAPTSSPNSLMTSEGSSSSTVPVSSSTVPFSSSTVPLSSPSPSPTDSDGGSHHGDHGSRALARQLPNGPGSVDTPVTLSYNFTGTAIYLFSIQPPTEAPVGGTPTSTNLSFTLDDQPAGNFSPTVMSTEFLPNTSVLSLDGLSNQPHQLVVTVGNDSVFLFDYLIYTNSSDGTSEPQNATPKNDKKNNVATFAGALGGSVGVLSLFSLGIAISIIRRRILAARRDRLDNEANPTCDTASMSGPAPFVPRFFPDTIIPQDPPNYNDALSSTNHNNTPLLASLVSSIYSSRQRSYADIPPTSPPPRLDELPPPPPFPLSLSAPVLDPPAVVTIPSIPAADQTDQGSESSDSESSNVISPHEDTPLLHPSEPSDNDSRPRSRASTRSLELSENSETNLHQEDAS